MRVVVVGATGNHGSSLVRRLARDPEVEHITGIARRMPSVEVEKVRWLAADVTKVDLTDAMRGADAVVHLAWLIQPARHESITHRVNVEGSRAVFEAAARAEVPAIVYASSVGAYSPGPKDRRVDESWPTNGVASSYYSRHKAAVERILDSFEAAHPDIRVARLRPGLVFKREAASQIRRLFVGPFLPNPLVRRGLIPFFPAIARLRFQAVHTDDLAEAYRLAVVRDDARGAFNIAADPVLDPQTLGDTLSAARIPFPGAALRAAAGVTHLLHLQPTSPDWVDMGLSVPLMDTTRAERELGWEPRRTAVEAFVELFDGIRDGAGFETPPLDPETSGPLRIRELLTGVGHAPR